MTNETEIDTIVIDKVMKFGDLLFCDCCYIGICLLYSPRVWRWSSYSTVIFAIAGVFSTCVEVIPKAGEFLVFPFRILHVCGGDPKHISFFNRLTMYSPRVWRWSFSSDHLAKISKVFSTCVEVIPTFRPKLTQKTSILHVCGGDPWIAKRSKMIGMYSPRVWRWSSIKDDGYTMPIGILHVCGGDPFCNAWTKRKS